MSPPARGWTGCGRAARRSSAARYAILGGAMSWVSEKHLVSAISNAGGFGVIACGAMSPAQLAEQIAGTQALTDKPFGVNLITMHPELNDLIRVTLEAKVGHIVLAGGIPAGAGGPRGQGRRRQADRVLPGAVAGQAPGPLRRRCHRHRGFGSRRPYRPGFADRPGAGDPAASARCAGVRRRRPRPRRGDPVLSLKWAHPARSSAPASPRPRNRSPIAKFKKFFVHANARDAMPSVELDPRLPVIPVRGLVNDGTKRFMQHQAETRDKLLAGEVTKEEAQLLVERFWAGALRRAVIDGDIETGFGHGRPVGRDGDQHPAGRRDHPGTDRPGGRGSRGAG